MVALFVVELISLPCLIHLWIRRDATLPRKLLWTVPVLLPMFGPMLYGAAFQPLPQFTKSSAPRPADAVPDGLDSSSPGPRGG